MQLVKHAGPHEKLFSQALSEMGKDGAHPTLYTSRLLKTLARRVSLTSLLPNEKLFNLTHFCILTGKQHFPLFSTISFGIGDDFNQTFQSRVDFSRKCLFKKIALPQKVSVHICYTLARCHVTS